MFANATRFTAQAIPAHDEHGLDVVVVVAKATLVLRAGTLVMADDQIPVRLADVPTDPAAVERGEESSIRYPRDVGGEKPGADVVVVGSAFSTTKVTSLDVAVRTPLGAYGLRVHGERVFYKGLMGYKLSAPAAFETAPITYERAYGGKSRDGTVCDWRNPVGRGVHGSSSELDGAPAPCIEDPAHPIDGARPSEPVGFGAIPMWWIPRRDLAGTMDAAWQATRMPLPPVDFDRRFHHVAPAALQLNRPLREGDLIATHGLSPEGLFKVTVPALAPIAHVRRTKAPATSVPLVLDTALLEPAEQRVELTFRRVLPLGRGNTLLREVRLDVDA